MIKRRKKGVARSAGRLCEDRAEGMQGVDDLDSEEKHEHKHKHKEEEEG